MDVNDLKVQILKRINVAKHTRRSLAVFTDDNYYNPLVLQDCPRCGGNGTVSLLGDC